MSRQRLTVLVALAMMAVLSVGLPMRGDVTRRPERSPEPVRFNRDIRPLLSDRCFPCHGFDENQRKADLRLDTWDGLTADLGGAVPVAPGDPESSEIVGRIEDDDPKYSMPPPESGLSLTDAERELIRRWVAEGAPFETHWAFVKPEPVEPPRSDETPVRNAIDRFVFARLARSGLAPSDTADRATLARRASLDLTGLPATPEEIDAFVADQGPDAWGRVLDRLLDSPRFGERMALMWLDAARYADTNGFHHDNERTIWPWRDWVIGAFNSNMPYDRFVTEQIAGDLVPEATEQQRIASAFCRLHNINDEGGALDEEYRVEAVADRIETIATVFMGLTFTCARCHDHKYDPITQDDYYSLYAYFNSVDERGVYRNDFKDARAYPARLEFRPRDLPERLEAAEASLAAARTLLRQAEPPVIRELEEWEARLREELSICWVEADVVDASGGDLEIREDGSVALIGKPPATATHEFTLHSAAADLRLLRLELLGSEFTESGRIGSNSHGNVVITEITAEAVSRSDPTLRAPVEWAWAWADVEQQNGDFDIHNALRPGKDGWAPAGHLDVGPRTAYLVSREPFGFPGGTEVRVKVAYRSQYAEHIAGRIRLGLATAAAAVVSEFPTMSAEWWMAGPFQAESFEQAFETDHGPEKLDDVTRGRKWGNVALKHAPKVRDGKAFRVSAERAAYYFVRTLRTPVPRTLEASLGSDDGIRVFLNGEEILSNPARRGVEPDQELVTLALRAGTNVLVIKIVNDGGPGGFYHRATPAAETPGRWRPAALSPSTARDGILSRRLLETRGGAGSGEFATLLERVRELEAALEDLASETVPVLVMKENAEPTQAHVLLRGHYSSPDENRPVTRRPPAVLGGKLPEGAPADRLGFARWLVDADHPLTARVHVNRIWQMIFGTGIVATSENFGVQSEWPSHPELLDWLAHRFIASGWDQKALLKLILDSATYRQASALRPDARAVDPENRLLSSFPRRRLPGEAIRDQALYAAGLLVEKVGGPSVKPYQPEGLWREVSIGASSNTQIFRRDDGEALHRRSLYTFWKRTSPNPQMTAFDAPTREFCVVRRGSTNTPLQALVIWNDVQFLEAARALAQRTLTERESRADRAALLFRRATGRVAGAAEAAILAETLAGFERRYEAAPQDAAELVKVGETPVPMDADVAELASWMMLASTVLSLDETIVRD